MLSEEQEATIYYHLLADEAKRDRTYFDYTADAIMDYGITRYSVWPEPNQNVADIIAKKVDYNALPFDDLNEFHKGMANSEQQDVIMRHEGEETLCEAQNLQPCLEEKCILYNSELGPPVCREFKMVFKKKV